MPAKDWRQSRRSSTLCQRKLCYVLPLARASYTLRIPARPGVRVLYYVLPLAHAHLLTVSSLFSVLVPCAYPSSLLLF